MNEATESNLPESHLKEEAVVLGEQAAYAEVLRRK